MTRFKRGILGASIGALIILLCHPASRSYFGLSLWNAGNSKLLLQSPYLLKNRTLAPQPNDVASASYWMQLAARLYVNNQKLSQNNLEKLRFIAEHYGSAHPDNGFWRQMQSWVLWELGQKEQAKELWMKAALAQGWNDLQSERLLKLESQLNRQYGKMSWIPGLLLWEKSDDIAQLISRQAKRMRSLPCATRQEQAEIQAAIIRNGVLLREGGRFIPSSLYGVDVIEAASRPGYQVSKKTLLLARLKLLSDFKELGMADESRRAEAAFTKNDSFIMIDEEIRQQRISELTWIGLAAAVIPGGLLLISILGMIIALIGRQIEKSRRLQRLFRPKVAPKIGIALSLIVYAYTRLPWPSLWVAACLGFFAFVPAATRKRPPTFLGPMFRFTLGILGAVIALLLLIFVAGWTVPGIWLMPRLGVPAQFGSGSTVILALVSVIFGLVLLTAPTWGLVQRYAPARLIGLVLRELGTGLALSCFALALISGPIAVWADAQVHEALEQALSNETLFYFMNN